MGSEGHKSVFEHDEIGEPLISWLKVTSTACHWLVLDAATPSSVACISKQLRTVIPFRNNGKTKWNWTHWVGQSNPYRQRFTIAPTPYGDDMPLTESLPALRLAEVATAPPDALTVPKSTTRKPPQGASTYDPLASDPLLTVDDVARRLNVSKDWVWDHSSRKMPRLPVIRMGDGTLRYRASGIEDFISERERVSSLRSGRR